jgi:hypothetical protein
MFMRIFKGHDYKIMCGHMELNAAGRMVNINTILQEKEVSQ